MPDLDPPTERITGLCSMATRHLLADLGAEYERRSGVQIALTAIGGVDAVRRVESGDRFDFVVLTADAVGRLSSGGYLSAADRTDLAESGIAIAVAAGGQAPDISTEEGVRDALLSARRVGYSSGPSGTHLLQLLQRWGISDVMRPRLVKAPPGTPVATLISEGAVDLGFQQRSELLGMPGIAIVGDMPIEIQSMTTFSGAPMADAANASAARQFLAFAASADARHSILRGGMVPLKSAKRTAPSGANASS